jgi:hypothetical protein
MALIHGLAFLRWLRDSGIVPENTRRVVIEAGVDTPVTIYCEQFGSEALVSVEAPPIFEGAKVVVKG